MWCGSDNVVLARDPDSQADALTDSQGRELDKGDRIDMCVSSQWTGGGVHVEPPEKPNTVAGYMELVSYDVIGSIGRGCRLVSREENTSIQIKCPSQDKSWGLESSTHAIHTQRDSTIWEAASSTSRSPWSTWRTCYTAKSTIGLLPWCHHCPKDFVAQMTAHASHSLDSHTRLMVVCLIERPGGADCVVRLQHQWLAPLRL